MGAMRSRLELLLGAMLLGGACAPSPSGEPQASKSKSESSALEGPNPQPGQEPDQEARSTSDLRLRWSLEAGDRWTEQASETMYMLEHPTQEVDEHRAAVTTTRVERFEVLDATPTLARLSMTPTALEVSIDDGAESVRVDERSAPEALIKGLAAQKLAYVGIPLVVSVTPRGEAEQVHDAEAYTTAVRARFEELAKMQAPTERQDARAALDAELANLVTRLSGQGMRPPLPAEPLHEGTTWTQQLRAPSLFEATVVYDYTYEVDRLTDTKAIVKLRAEGRIEPTPAMEEYIASATLKVRGDFEMDRRRGLLLEHEETLEMSVEIRPHPMLGKGGTLATRLERTRVRQGEPL